MELYQAEWCLRPDLLHHLSHFRPGPNADAHREKAREEVPAFTPL